MEKKNMESKLLLRKEELVNNPTARVPVCLCLDVSSSMEGAPIKELNQGVTLFYDSLKEDEMAMYSAEIAVVTFGGYGAQCLEDFSSLQIQPKAPVLEAYGNTPMGEAVNMAIDLLEQRKAEYREKGVDYYQPWLVLMTDGAPNGDPNELARAIERTQTLVGTKKLTVFPIGIGEYADMNMLANFSPKRQPLKLQGLKFKEFFEWLSQSVSRTSQSTPGESVELNTDKLKSWASLDN